MDQLPRKPMAEVSPTAGMKRPAPTPTLLPAFEPLSSSPPLPRPTKRVARDLSSDDSPVKYPSLKWQKEIHKYPTPVPTSSTGLMSSSPPPLPLTRRKPRLERTVSALSERAPLASVPSIELDAGGEETLLGRSGRSSNYQLSTSKLISRVHVRAMYVPANPPQPAKVELVCPGWNGMKIHCQGKAWELGKDDTFTSESEGADIMVDIQDARVLLQWPKPAKRVTTPADSESGLDSEHSPRRDGTGRIRRTNSISPLARRARLQSPVSPTPANSNPNDPMAGLFAHPSSAPVMVQIYEDSASEGENEEPKAATQPTQSTQRLTQPLGLNSDLSQPQDENELSEQDEENDPVVHSFGPFGENLLPRMASFTAGASPDKKRTRDAMDERPAAPDNQFPVHDDNVQILINHAINQLAYSRLSSTPLSTIMSHLPAEMKSTDPVHKERHALSLNTLRILIESVACIGEVTREGKDAAGKALESEFYYIPDTDIDESRREAVVNSLRKPGLRACRKQHKQYYWRKPK